VQAEGVVFKIVPMEGSTPVNGEQQKCAGDILAEVDISLRLSRLRGEPGAPLFLAVSEWSTAAGLPCPPWVMDHPRA
jgi:hypothetical protein